LYLGSSRGTQVPPTCNIAMFLYLHIHEPELRWGFHNSQWLQLASCIVCIWPSAPALHLACTWMLPGRARPGRLPADTGPLIPVLVALVATDSVQLAVMSQSPPRAVLNPFLNTSHLTPHIEVSRGMTLRAAYICTFALETEDQWKNRQCTGAGSQTQVRRPSGAFAGDWATVSASTLLIWLVWASSSCCSSSNADLPGVPGFGAGHPRLAPALRGWAQGGPRRIQ